MIDGPRGCRASEFEEVIALINSVFRTGTDQDIRTDYPLVLTRRELAQLIFGPHPAAKPVECSGVTGEILRTIFPFYVPIWELDHS